MHTRYALAFGIIVTTAWAADEPVKMTPKKVLEGYKTFARITKEPKPIGVEFWDLCSEPPPKKQVEKEIGPHAMGYLHYYLNEIAEHHRNGGGKGEYPTGSVIVKEKLFGGASISERAFQQVVAVAGMIKGAPGSSPKAHDWEFFYFSPRGSWWDTKPDAWAKAKEVASCAGCHSNAPDMVFGRFNEPYKMPKPGENRKTI